jgi:DAK2 domain fusion protein YloV
VPDDTQEVRPVTDAPVQRLDATLARRWAVTLRAVLAERRAEIDDLNVFPVPDGDTGTNLYLTIDGAMAALRDQLPAAGWDGRGDLGALSAGLATTTLLSARGNSGVILSQLVRGFSEVIAEADDAEHLDATALARALRRGSDLARASVSHPVEGTILSVAAAAAGAAEEAATSGSDLYAVTLASLDAARSALARTPEQLPALARAGVVDAGGAGYVLLLEALGHVLSGRPHEDLPWRGSAEPVGQGGRAATATTATTATSGNGPAAEAPGEGEGGAVPSEGQDGGDAPAYEVMYLLEDSSDHAVEELRGELDRLGDSLIVVGGPEVWNVHGHVNDVGAALEAGVRAGRPHRITVTRFSDARTGEREHRARAAGGPAVAVVACAAGDGLSELFRAGGAQVVRGGPGRRASTGELLAAARRTDGEDVLLLPSDSDTELAAEAAVRVGLDEGLRLHVVRSVSAVQCIAAFAVFDPDRPAADNLDAMNGAAAGTRHGAITAADRDAVTTAGPCRAGDVLGLVDGEIVCVGSGFDEVGAEVAVRLLGGGGELLTVVTGHEAPGGLADAVAAAARTGRLDLEVSVIEGGQPVYPLLLGVE